MQIALVAVVLLAGMWFTVLKPKSADSTSASSAPAATTSQPVAPGVKGLTADVAKAKAAAATSDAANAKIQAATGGSTAATATSSAPAATATATATPKHTTVTKKPATATATKKTGTKAATEKAAAAKPATATKTSTAAAKATTAAPAATTAPKTAAATATADVDPSTRLLAYLKQGKTLVILFYGKGADDRAARKAVHQTAKADPKNVVSAYIPITKVGDYSAITSDVNVLAAPTILVISTKGKATQLTGYVDAPVVRRTVAAARAAAASGK